MTWRRKAAAVAFFVSWNAFCLVTALDIRHDMLGQPETHRLAFNVSAVMLTVSLIIVLFAPRRF